MIHWPKRETTWQQGRTLYVSVPFTWRLPAVRAMLGQRSFIWDHAVAGGPAVKLMPNFLLGIQWVTVDTGDLPGVLQRVNPDATRTTVGCTRSCRFCAVRQLEGHFRELDDWPDTPVLCDNNLLAASTQHFDRVMDRLERHGWCDFNQGLDARLMTEHHAERIGRIPKAMCRLALDSTGYANQWHKAFTLLRKHGTAKHRIRTYALIGFNDSPDEAWGCCEWIESHKVMALPMWHHALDQLKPNIVREDQRANGWSDFERQRIMRWYYKHQKMTKKG